MSGVNTRRCIVVGAGVAGMSAAMHCVRNNIPVVVLESRASLGGRAHSFVDPTSREVLDNGQHLMMGCYTAFRQMLRELGTESLLSMQPSLRVHFRTKSGSKDLFESRLFSGSVGAAAALFGLRSLDLQSKLRATAMMLSIQLGAKAKANETTLEFLQRYKQTPAMMQLFWEPLVLATLNAKPSLVSASLFVQVLRLSILAGGDNASLMIPQAGLSDLYSTFASHLAAHRSELHFSSAVKNVVMVDGRACGVSTVDDREYRGDAVIIATPPKAALRLGAESSISNSPSILADQVQAQPLSPIVSLYLWFDKDFMQEDFVALIGTTTQWVFNKRRMSSCSAEQRARYPGHLALTISAADELRDVTGAEIIEICLKEIRTAFPESRDATLLHSRVIRERFATLRAEPEVEASRPGNATKVPGLYLAGDWTNTGLPATLEGAARSGIEAVNTVLMSW